MVESDNIEHSDALKGFNTTASIVVTSVVSCRLALSLFEPKPELAFSMGRVSDIPGDRQHAEGARHEGDDRNSTKLGTRWKRLREGLPQANRRTREHDLVP